MLFAIICTDHPDSLELRMSTRPAHLEHLNRYMAQLRLCGPLLTDGKPTGSLIVLEAETLADAEKFAANDPYTIAGLFSDSRVQPYRVVFENGERAA
jgi:uncharacterized protein YciI